MRRLHILLATDLSNVGGTELSTLSIGRWMKKAGHDVTLIANEHSLVQEFRKHGIVVVPAAVNRRDIVGVIQTVRDIGRFVTDQGVDIVHAQQAWTALLAALAGRALRYARVPVVWHCRGVKPETYRLMGLCGSLFVDHVIANCDSERQRLVDLGLSPRMIHTVYNFPNVDFPERIARRTASFLKEWCIQPGTVVVGTASRLAEDRGVEYFVDAIALLPRHHRAKARFVVIGDGPQRAYLRSKAADAGLANTVTFVGATRDMERVYSTLDIVVNPVLFGHGTGNLNSEAMAWGKPVVATNIGGIPELVEDGVTGFLVPPREPSRLAEAISYMLAHPDVARRMGLAGRHKVAAMMTPERIVGQIEHVYSLVLPSDVDSGR